MLPAIPPKPDPEPRSRSMLFSDGDWNRLARAADIVAAGRGKMADAVVDEHIVGAELVIGQGPGGNGENGLTFQRGEKQFEDVGLARSGRGVDDDVPALAQGVHGVRVTYDYTWAAGASPGSADTFDQVALTNADQTVLYLLIIHCTTACYSQNRNSINDIMSSFTVRSPL